MREFKKFIMSASVIYMAAGMIIGAAFRKIVNSLSQDVLAPPLGLWAGKVDFPTFFITLKEAWKSAARMKLWRRPMLHARLQ